MMNRDAASAFRGAVGQRADELLGRAFAAHVLFQIGKALDEKDRRDDGGIEIVEQDRLIEIEAFQRRFVENQRWPLRHEPIMHQTSEPLRARLEEDLLEEACPEVRAQEARTTIAAPGSVRRCARPVQTPRCGYPWRFH